MAVGKLSHPHRALHLSFVLGGMLLLWGHALQQVHAVDFPLRWRWSNPNPHGNNIVDMAYHSPLQLGVQVAELGQIYTSSDLTFWTPRPSGTTLNLRAVTFLTQPATRIIITGENGTVLHGTGVDDFQPGTLIDGPTTDWLEAVTAAPNLAVAVGDQGAIYTSTNGIAWKRQSPSPQITTWLRGVAYGNGVFVAVGESGFIARSQNGTNWFEVNSGTRVNLNRVSFGNNTFTAVGEQGFTMTSTTGGGSWFIETTGASGELFHAANAIGDRIIVGEEEVRTEETGAWHDELSESNAPPAWTYLANIGLPNYFMIAGRTGLISEGFKTNATSYFWRNEEDNVRHWLFDSFYATNFYVAVGDRATVMTSGNGIDWNLEFVPNPATNAIFLGIGGDTNLLVTAGSGGALMVSPNILTNFSFMVTNSSGGVTTSNITLSSLGVLWHPIEPRPTSDDLQGVTFGHGLYVVSGDNGTMLTSPDGTNWTSQSTPSSALLSGLTSHPGGFVCTGDDGTLLSSPDGTNWTLQTSGTMDWIYKVRCFGNTLLAVGQNGTMLSSSDGLDWQTINAGTSAWLNDVTRVENTYFAVGSQGTVLSSTNLMNWTDRGTITKKALYFASSDATQLVIGGVEGIILRSPIVPDLTPIRILSYARIQSESNPDLIQNLYLFGGKPDQQFTLDRRADLLTSPWTTGTQLEFFQSDGTLFYLEAIQATNAPSQEFYEATLLP